VNVDILAVLRVAGLGTDAHALLAVDDTWISGSDVNTFCCYGLASLLDPW